ncbi:hypothetical protein MLP_24930 [Microlunatus phosphovorus NM-1]|uniref:Uncharacterized protein n=1 Tax=Microlunatus phosphovorus (strain ATCC 700054 / DSM 10555 / JCM 9379 / NBRC 101784 / NCIMB 13414 / VKM Ac-1990 / NM-1) TaxID=1032480 RepID=F5XGM5_MICPN|nr:hypothetical protein MLP_24930 [Microlunatus phosphovorus NM-1]
MPGVRFAPPGHTRPQISQQARTSRARGPKTTATRAEQRYVLRPRAKDDRHGGVPGVRFAPPGHTRPQISQQARTSRARGPKTTATRAEQRYVLRPRAKDDRHGGVPGVRFAPPGHTRPQISQQARTSRARGPKTTATRAEQRGTSCARGPKTTHDGARVRCGAG